MVTMAVVDPYSPCPCGSGEKFKWCCQKVEAYAERAQRLHENGQLDLALDALEEGLRKQPDNPWLLMRKAMILSGADKPQEAKPVLQRLVSKQPGHMGAQALLVRVVVETEGPIAGAAQFQQALSSAPPERRASLALMAQMLGVLLSEAGEFAAGLRHLELGMQLGGRTEPDPNTLRTLQFIETNAAILPWIKNPYTLSPAPAGLKPALRDRFEQAIRWAEEGLWSSASSAFETLSADGAGIEADRNLGLCRLWIADEAGATAALRRFVKRAGETDEAVDIEALAQLTAPVDRDDLVERVQLIWPVRDRDALLAALNGQATFVPQGPVPLDADDEHSPEVDLFVQLDRPRVEARTGLKASEIPKIVAHLFVGTQIVALEAFDDERLGPLADRFTALAAGAIAPAHPRTKVMGDMARSTLPFVLSWLPPEGLSASEQERLDREERSRIRREVWPNVPQPFLGRQTPLQAAKAGNARVPLRAAVLRLELQGDSQIAGPDFAWLREQLGLAPEPEIDPETADIGRLHLSRLHLIPVDRLSDDRLIELYRRARRTMLSLAIDRAARALVQRPALFDAKVSVVSVYADLASASALRGDRDESVAWLQKGRQAEPAAQRSKNAPSWDMTEIELRTGREDPEAWVPELAVVMERYRDDAAANQTLFRHLLGMGLIRLMPNPDDPKTMLLDTRTLQALISQYGPKVTTASGHLGVSATKGGIWTPGSSSSGSGGGLWTPGSEAGSGASGEKPKLIIPGR
jgi:tetratricopeptide (TPR) repeat protein